VYYVNGVESELLLGWETRREIQSPGKNGNLVSRTADWSTICRERA